MPDNWADTIALAKKIRTADVAGLAYNIHDWPDDWLWRGIVQQGGHTLLDASGKKVAFGGDVGLKALETLRSLVTEDGMPLIDWDQSRQQFIAGKIGIFFDTPARLRQVTDLVGERFTLKTALFPVNDKAKGTLPTGGNAAIITAKDPVKQKAAWEFVKFVTGPEGAEDRRRDLGLHADQSACRRGRLPRPVLQGQRQFPHDQRPGEPRLAPGRATRAANSVRIWRQQREVIAGVMRGEIQPKAGIERMVSETEALMK
jgi:multiple sugar transport system substrate-binding protein